MNDASHMAPARARHRARVVVHEPEPPVVRAALASQDYDVVSCSSGSLLLEEVVRQPPAAVVYALGADAREDMGVLLILRQAAHDLPLVLLATRGSLAAERQLRDLRPIYYGLLPMEDAELISAVSSAVSRARAG